jgi:hypothetical protein
MKKYLICGAMALVAGFYLTSCTHDDIGYDNLYDEKTQTFEKVFKDLYGTIDPNHDWGFTPVDEFVGGSAASASSRALTRGATRGVNANANEWADPNKEYGGWIVPNPLTNEQKDKVRRYFQTHPNPNSEAFRYSNFFVQQVYKGGDNVGTNSPEKYTAADGTTTIVGGEQMDKLTCGSYSEGAQTAFYYDHIYNFNNGTCSWNNDVLDNGQTVGGSTHSDQIMLMVDSKSDCFGYWNSNGSVGFNDKYVIIPGDVIQAWDNTGGDNADVSGMFFVGFDYEQLIDGDVYTGNYYTFEGQQYRYLSAQMNRYCGDKKEYNDVPSADVIRDLLSKGYLPVEGKADKVFVKLAECADGYYSDWIVRVIPGTKKSTGGDKDKDKEETSKTPKYRGDMHRIMNIGRIFVEDLYKATREDLDFNDAVFDAIIWQEGKYIIDETKQVPTERYKLAPNASNKYRVEIALLAAGGTIPLTIAGSKFGDVHNAFGVGLTTIVNTVGEASNVFGSLVTGKDYVYKQFDYTTELAGTNYTLNDIPIDVEWVTNDIKVAARLNNAEILEYEKDENGNFKLDSNGKLIAVATTGQKAPHIIRVPIGTPWSQERVNIGTATEGPYRNFPAYVSDKSVKFWNSNVEEFFLYPDNRSPLAYSDKEAGDFYFTNIEEILYDTETKYYPDGTIVDGKEETTAYNFEIPTTVFEEGDVIRVYGGLNANQNDPWVNFSFVRDDWAWLSVMNAKPEFKDGYFEIPIDGYFSWASKVDERRKNIFGISGKNIYISEITVIRKK